MAFLAAELVVGLPADDIGRLGEVLGHGPRDALGEPPVIGVRIAVVLAAAPDDLRAVGLGPQGLGVLLGDPGGHDGGGGAEDHVDAVAGEQLDRVIQPAEVELALARLHVDPGELRQPDNVEAGLLHEPGVGLPSLAGPVSG